MINDKDFEILMEAAKLMEGGFSRLPFFTAETDDLAVKETLLAVADKLKDNYPYFHPFYAGQMMKPPHPVARLAYMLTLWINPNNHALDGGKASSAMEKEAVANIAKMFGWKTYLGHLTSGGTMANLEALWISGKLGPKQIIVASEQAHYTHGRISEVLGLKFKPVPCDDNARMDINALEDILKRENVGTVVTTAGTTGVGSIDPLPDILELKTRFGFRVHIDSAYGGYYTLADNLSEYGRKVFNSFKFADSIVIDPHKHGLQPYGCGCVLFRKPEVGQFYKHDSPYTYFSSSDLHLGEISLECSRAGASAVALWATQKLLPMEKGGKFASDLTRCRKAALALFDKFQNDSRFLTIMEPETDIVVWAPRAGKASEISQLSKEIFEAAAEKELHLAVFNYPAKQLKEKWTQVDFDQDHVACLRSCIMKPEHFDWLEEIWKVLSDVTDEVRGS